jgi:hypothetical protein
MKKMNIIEASEHFGVSKEAIHNRIRRGSLSSVVEDGVKLVLVDESKTAPKPRTMQKKSASQDERYYKLLEEQNAKLQSKVDSLESETRSLRDQKEQMLIDERMKIEQIYKDKDEQLKSILTSFKAQFLLAPQQEEHLDAEIEEIKEIAVESDIESKKESKSGVISLKKFLKEQKLSEKKIQKIKTKFKKRVKKDERVIIIGKKYYINPEKYDYRDLLK